MTVPELASTFGVPVRALYLRILRFRIHIADRIYEDANGGGRRPTYRYHLRDVRAIVDALREKQTRNGKIADPASQLNAPA